MAANFWKSSHCTKWLLEASDLQIAHERDTLLLEPREVAVFHIFFANAIQKIGGLRSSSGILNQRQKVVATATVYFKRFFFKNALTDIDPVLLLETCLYLAIKVEECGPVYVKDVNDDKFKQIQEKLKPLKLDKRFDNKQIVEAEFILMQELDYSLLVFHPYRDLLEFVEDAFGDDAKSAQRVREMAWKMANDTYRCNLCLRYPPYLIALGCLCLACTVLDFDKSQWFASLNVNIIEVMEVVQALHDLYNVMRDMQDAEIVGIMSKIRKEVKRLDSLVEA